ncbi:glycosyltransferase family 2 protein [Nocardioides jensenii]|uniref:glycosyltransferase family 2 protein n=1 Tax=Nocardioides jensenii TaxID=1843 RepID=UPI0008374AAE|nr:glycosyltransferase [Nocardioides jensenii]
MHKFSLNSERGFAPKVSVIMATYNCVSTVEAAVESIMRQSYTNWEFIICDDGSTDDTFEVLQSLAERCPAIQLLRNETNRKLAHGLNRCLMSATGELVARMDADDVSTPERLEEQVRYLRCHPQVDLVGTSMRRFDSQGLGDVVHAVLQPDRHTLRRAVPFCHATVMAWRRVFDQLGGYTDEMSVERVEDIDLWFRFFRAGFQGRNIDLPLYLVREDISAVRRRTWRNRVNLFRTTVRGFAMLDYPRWWLIYPALDLLKVIVPARAVMFLRSSQRMRPSVLDRSSDSK